MERHGWVIGIRQDNVEKYKSYHAKVWPEVLQVIRECNIRNYSVFYKDNNLFSYFEYVGNDYEGDMDRLRKDRRMREWLSIMDPMQIPLETRAQGEWWAGMEEVFHTD